MGAWAPRYNENGPHSQFCLPGHLSPKDYPDRYLDEAPSICPFPTPFQLATWAKLHHIAILLEIFEESDKSTIGIDVWDSPPTKCSFKSLENLKGLLATSWEDSLINNLDQRVDLTEVKQDLTTLLYALHAPYSP